MRVRRRLGKGWRAKEGDAPALPSRRVMSSFSSSTLAPPSRSDLTSLSYLSFWENCEAAGERECQRCALELKRGQDVR